VTADDDGWPEPAGERGQLGIRHPRGASITPATASTARPRTPSPPTPPH